MKKIIWKILSIVAAFFLGIVCMSYYQTAGNNDLTESMGEASLPLIYMEQDGELLNLMHGYRKPMEGRLMRDSILALPKSRNLKIYVESPNLDVKEVSYEVRSLDTERLIENAPLEGFVREGKNVSAEFQLKDLLDPGEEYLLVLRLGLEKDREAYYYTRIVNLPENHLKECKEFAEEIHEALFDKHNTVPISQYLEPDSSADNGTLEHVTIHSRYAQMVWGSMGVQPASEVRTYITELESSIASLRLEYEVSYENGAGELELYEVEEAYRVRYTEQRMYLLNYDRRVNRIFDPGLSVFTKDAVWLGILDTEVEHRKNEEENIVGFVQNGQLWCYDVAQNKLSYVFGFRDGEDLRCSYGEHDIKIIDIDESGSMNFLVYGYMNRGLHEGETGVAVYTYDALTNSVEERIFIESDKPFQILQSDLGDLAYVTRQEQLYLYFQGSICKIDLNTREYTKIVSGISKECCMTSPDGRMVAWHRENSLYETETIEMLSLDTGRRHSISAKDGFYMRALGFLGTDFIYGEARKEDIQKDITGSLIFPMGRVTIEDGVNGRLIRESVYEEQGKYVLSISIESNWISLACVAKDEAGGYRETEPELLTNTTEEPEEKIELSTKTSAEKKREYYFALSAGNKDSKMKYLKPKQVVFDGSRNLIPEKKEDRGEFYVYAFNGKFVGAYSQANAAVRRAYDVMGVVVDENQSYIWERGSRRLRIEISGVQNPQQKPEETSMQAAIEILLGHQKTYMDTAVYLAEGYTPYEILSDHMDGRVFDLSGCSLSMVLYYVSQGHPVMVLESDSQAELITGYDPRNIVLTDPLTGEAYRKGMNDSAQAFEELGNLFVAFLPEEE